jgi:hypothetical protein
MVIKILPLNHKSMDKEIDLCLKFHPSGKVPNSKSAEKGRELKRKFLEKVFEKVEPAGFIALDGDKPVGLLELMPREYARRNGYITGSRGTDKDVLTIVCLEVSLGENRKKVMNLLVSHLLDNLHIFSPFKEIEVGAFLGDVEFHPSWVYEKHGFKVIEERGNARILKIQIPFGKGSRGLKVEKRKGRPANQKCK